MSLIKSKDASQLKSCKHILKNLTLSVQMIAEKLNVTTEDVEKVLAMTAPLGIFSHQLQRFIHLVWMSEM